MIQIDTLDAKASLPYLLTRIEKEHEKIRICRDGKPIAFLVPISSSSKNPLKQNSKLMGVKVHEDPTRPLDDEDWPCDSK